MAIDFNPEVSNLGKVNSAGEAKQSGKTNKTDNFIPLITMNGDSFKKITENDIENAVNEPSSLKAAKSLLANSPIGLNDMPDKETLEKMGYSFAATAMHIGAPMVYKSPDGGTITVYNGNGTAEMGEDKRKIVYQNGRYTQEMYYDDNGKLTDGKIIIKDNIAGFTEVQYDFTVKDNKLASIIK